MSNAKQLVQDLIAGNTVFVASKSYCPYCTATKTLLLKTLGLKEKTDDGEDEDAVVKIIELDNRKDGAEIQRALYEITGQSTVPNVFIKGKHIGGNSDLQALHSRGGVQQLLA